MFAWRWRRSSIGWTGKLSQRGERPETEVPVGPPEVVRCCEPRPIAANRRHSTSSFDVRACALVQELWI